MTALGGMVACGKRGGFSFIESRKVDIYSMECPKNYEPCSPFTKPAETVCIKKGSDKADCPIIDILVIDQSFEPTWQIRGYKTTEKSYPYNGDSTTKIAFSKTTARLLDKRSNDPIIGFAINTNIPCYGYDSDRLILNNDQMSKIKFTIEKEVEPTVAEER